MLMPERDELKISNCLVLEIWNLLNCNLGLSLDEIFEVLDLDLNKLEIYFIILKIMEINKIINNQNNKKDYKKHNYINSDLPEGFK